MGDLVGSVLFDDTGGRFVSWKVAERGRVVPGTAVLEYELDGVKKKLKTDRKGIAFREKKLKAGDELTQGQVVMNVEECKHAVEVKGMCGDCGEDLRLIEQTTSGAGPEPRGASVAMIHHIPELIISPELAKEQGRIDLETVLKQRKLFLLVDLDQTLIHTTNEMVSEKLENVYHYQLYGPASPAYHTRIRPHTRHFLESMFSLYEMHICTFGQRLYAHTVAKFLDPDGKLFGKRILSRDECFDPMLKTANLKALFPCGDQLTAIIDDREDVWQYADNLVHVKPYRFFRNTGDINAPPQAVKTEENTEHQFQFSHPKTEEKGEKEEKEKGEKEGKEEKGEKATDSPEGQVQAKKTLEGYFPDVGPDQDVVDDTDDYLLFLETILTNVHKAFYTLYDKEPADSKKLDLKTIIPYLKKKVLPGVRIVFSGVFPMNVRADTTQIYKMAEAFGAVIQPDIVTKEQDETRFTTHLVAARWGTTKVNTASRLAHVHVVTPQWLWCCIERWERVDEVLFKLSPAVMRDPDRSRSLAAPPPSGQMTGTDGLHIGDLPVFSRDAIRRMSNEVAIRFETVEGEKRFQVDDALSDDDEEDNDGDDEEGRPIATKDDQGSSSGESMTGDVPRGWKRKSSDLALDQDLSGKAKIRRIDGGGGNDDSDDSDSDQDDQSGPSDDDDEMAEALEREMDDGDI